MKKYIYNNWGIKLASFAIAVILWVVVYNIDDPTQSKTLRNIPVTFINTEAITDNNQVYEVLDGTDVIRYVTVKGARSIVDNLGNTDITAEADFSKMKLDGTVEIKVYSNRYTGTVSFKPSSTEVQLHVEDKRENYYSLEVKAIGIPAEGYIVGSTKLELNRVAVSGAESKVSAVKEAKAIVDVTGANGDLFTYADIILYDEAGIEIPRDHYTLNFKTVGTTVEMLKTKTVPVQYIAEGTAAEGYVVTGEVASNVQEVVIAGKESAVADVNEIIVSGAELSFEGATEDVVKSVDLDNYLPEGIIRVDEGDGGRVDVAILIAPIVEKEYTIPMGQIEITNIPEGFSVVHVYASTEMSVTLKGSEHILKNLNEDAIKGSFDVTAWMEAKKVKKLKDKEVLVVEPVFEMGEELDVVSATSIEVIAKVVED